MNFYPYITIRQWTHDSYLVLLTVSLEISETIAFILSAEEVGQMLGN